MIPGFAPHRPLIIHSPDEEDLAFVLHQLLPALGLAREQVNLSGERRLGEFILTSLEEYVVESTVLLAVVSAALLRDGLSGHVVEMAQRHRERGGRFVPLVLADAELPPRLSAFEPLDCATPSSRARSFQRLRELLALPAPAVRDLPCPYRGLRPYDEASAASFAGRAHDARRVAAKLAPPHGVRELFLLGPSGSGKTSFLHAGLLPELRRRAPQGLDVRVARPAELLAEAQATTQPPRPAGPTLLAIDPLEELFALPDDQRAALVRHLERLRAEAQHQLVYCLRSDFRGELRRSPLGAAFEAAERVDLPPLQGRELAEALCAPARELGVALAPGLVRSLLHAARHEERGCLPILQLVLAELWPHREYHLLTEDSYRQLAGPHANGLSAILERQLSRAIRSLASVEDQRVALRVLLRLVQFGEGRADTRRRQPRQALASGEPPEQLERVLTHLTQHRLLLHDSAEGAPCVELAHETLIDAWPELQRFLAEHRSAARQRRALEQRALQWRARADPARRDGLLDEIELQEIHQQLTAEVLAQLGTSAVLGEFLRASRAHLDDERAERERQLQQQRAQLTRYLIDKAHSFLRGARPARAFPLLDEARSLGATSVALACLFHWARRGLPTACLPLDAPAAPRPAAATLPAALVEKSPLGSHLAIARGRVLRLFDLSADADPKRIEVSSTITGLSWAPAGHHLAVTSDDDTVRLWDAASGQVDSPLLEQPSAIQRLEWRDATALRVTTHSAELSWSPRYPPVPTPEASAAAPPAPPASLDVEFAARQLRAVAADRNVQVTAPAQQSRLDHRHPIVALAWSPEGERLAVACRDGTVRVWAPLDELVLLPDLHCKRVTSLAWSSDGAHLFAYTDSALAHTWPTPHHLPSAAEWEEARRAHAHLPRSG